jgi:two-component system, NtrC family, response regulator PilR
MDSFAANILVCDDEPDICTMLYIALHREGHKVETVNSGEAAKQKINGALYDVIISDIKMPGVDGVEVMRYAHDISPDSERIVITAHEDFEVARTIAQSGGVFQFIVKGPSLPSIVSHSVREAIAKLRLKRKNTGYRLDANSRNSLDNIVGAGRAMTRLKETIRAVASTSSTVLVHGESGTGKELVARAVHSCSLRAAEPFVCVNCGAFPETLLESELFGYVKGAFTGASQNKRGLFEAADGGTIFLDEIGEMSLSMQVKLLRVLQERTLRPVGGTAETPVDVRVIAATNQHLDEMVHEKTFREDLYYRLSVIPIEIPPLRERTEDIPLLANQFLKKFAPRAGKSIARIDRRSIERLCAYDWPGNVRQLENTIERAVALSSGEELFVDPPEERLRSRAAAAAFGGGATVFGLLPSNPSELSLPTDGVDMETYVADLERTMIKEALRQSNNVQTRAANMLKLSYRSFRHLLKKYDL